MLIPVCNMCHSNLTHSLNNFHRSDGVYIMIWENLFTWKLDMISKLSRSEHCAVPGKIHTQPMKGNRKFLGGGGS